ncbi:uncharacterized protein RCC_03956 [Ramularia collo-cygni]|uniref:Uncharacterized protein n=1 Tax=Ramularia collo-cygni TaxID=112498 RepID=A0A2D3V3K7_9PEZI|nr:uncharacterized protein RCC_03956 [Ramularia collo-cygni]CZT18116.1 uncharacterized protein RCC_03956 [Ramularia collo-cygni]
MKLYQAFLISVQFAAALSAAVDTAASECGDLGVLRVDNIPEGVNATDIRTCEAHPLGSSGVSSSANPTGLESGDNHKCYTQAPYGCTKSGKTGYCWKACGDTKKGEWCWLAGNNGFGAWSTCSVWSDCDTNKNQCGQGCRVSSSCGCGC